MMHLLRRQEGSAQVEVALILPIIIVMMLLVLDFGVLLSQDLRVADSARSAAQAGTVRLYARDMNFLRSIGTASAGDLPGYKVAAVSYCTCANGSGTASCASHSSCGNYGIPNQYVKVTATARLPLIFAMTGFPATINVQSVAIARTPWTGTN